MLFIPIALSVLTRPCTLIIETQDPGKTRQYLRQAATLTARPSGRRNDVLGEFYQIEAKDAWVFSFDFARIIKLRFGIEIDGNFVLMRNIPWSNQDRIERVREAALNGAKLEAFPSGAHLQLAGLHAAACDGYRAAATQGMACLYPLVASGYAAPENAGLRHAKLLGFTPVHPGDGQWLWQDYQLVSSQYGSAQRQRQPGYQEGDRDFGLMADIEQLSVNMQFEDSGLRTKVGWKLRAASK